LDIRSAQICARLGGVLLLASVVAGGFGEFWAPSHLVVPGDAAATAHRVIQSESLFRWGFIGYLIESVCDVGLAAVLYLLLSPVSRAVALFGAFFDLLATATFAAAELFYFAPSLILHGAAFLPGFSPAQLDGLALLSFKLYSAGGNLFQIHYGVASILFGALIFRSGYLPRLLGVIVALGGAGFVAWSFTFVLAPTFPTAILGAPTIIATPLLGLWLLVKGVDVAEWETIETE
jgi:hypothetical protein